MAKATEISGPGEYLSTVFKLDDIEDDSVSFEGTNGADLSGLTGFAGVIDEPVGIILSKGGATIPLAGEDRLASLPVGLVRLLQKDGNSWITDALCDKELADNDSDELIEVIVPEALVAGVKVLIQHWEALSSSIKGVPSVSTDSEDDDEDEDEDEDDLPRPTRTTPRDNGV